MTGPVSTRASRLLALFGVLALGGLAVADPVDVRALWQRPGGESGVTVVPGRYLRSWDPITVFFPTASGRPGPEHDPSKWARLSPDHPGAWTWIDGRTLRFEPAVAWPALGRSTIEVGGRTSELMTLLSAPIATLPADGAEDLDPVDTITLTFASPVPVDALRRLTVVELADLSGGGGTRVLGGGELVVKALPELYGDFWDSEIDLTNARSYEIRLPAPVPAGTRATVRVRVADDPAERESFVVGFRTAEPFRVVSAGCDGERVPVPLQGARYGESEALRCVGAPRVVVDLSAAPVTFGPIEARNLVRFEPAVEGLTVDGSYGRHLEVHGDFRPDVDYTVRISPSGLVDRTGRRLQMGGETSFRVSFRPGTPLFSVDTGEAWMERRGPQHVPVTLRGHRQADVRIYRVDPLDRAFTGFAWGPVRVPEEQRPAGPGERPPLRTRRAAVPEVDEQIAQIRSLGSPVASGIIEVPGGGAQGRTVGLDVAPLLKQAAGGDAVGTWLVGVRPVTGGGERQYLRVQVTDLSVTTVEEESGVRFLVTSLQTGLPVAGADVRIEGTVGGGEELVELGRGLTNAEGMFAWKAPGAGQDRSPVRLVVQRGGDVLTLETSRPPDVYQDRHWSVDGSDWLGWAFDDLAPRRPEAERLCHVFTERPVYRPGDEVHLEGWLRGRDRGVLSAVSGAALNLVVRAPDDTTWTEPVKTRPSGGFYWKWSAEEPPTGDYLAWVEDPDGAMLCEVPFVVDAYRIPTFEVDLAAPEHPTLDSAFEVALSADHYAGGPVADRPVRWRVSQYPLPWAPKLPEGFVSASDARFARQQRFEATPHFAQDGTTDARGEARLRLDPSVEPTLQPRTYVVEATVTGDDDQTVTSVKKVAVVPAFAVAVRAPRVLREGQALAPDVLLVGPDGAALPDREVAVRLIRREWHSRLQASDFREGEPRYLTDTVDVPVQEVKVRTAASPVSVPLPVDRSGVYLVQVDAHDATGRVQRVEVDLFAAGAGALAWPKAEARTFELSTDRATYNPGDRAQVVVRSPFADAEGLLVVEAPSGHRYQRFSVRGGQATVPVAIEGAFAPSLTVHALLMRGRTGAPPSGADALDLDKPATVAATTALAVNPRDNQLVVTLEAPEKALPGQKVPVSVRLRDADGRPVAGEVALWLVDEAVLSLGKEQRLDPLPDFLTAWASRLRLRDTRGLVRGHLPLSWLPGGDGDDEDDGFPPPTVRRDFRSVPYYEPFLSVPSTGNLTVQVALPDNLTVFAVRAKAASGGGRFGAATDEVAVRLPVVVQPVLPRFVRPGDAFVAGATARVIEGGGGAGSARISATGLVLSGPEKQEVAWDPAATAQLGFPLVVPLDAPAVAAVQVSAGRLSDGAGDAFSLELPVIPGVSEVVQVATVDLSKGAAPIAALGGGTFRAGSVSRRVVATDQPGLLQVIGALGAFSRYPYGGTEAVVSRARGFLAAGPLLAFAVADPEPRREHALREALIALKQRRDDTGLVSDWPGQRGSVSRTAWALSFLSEARRAGGGDPVLEGELAATLQRALASDDGRFVSGEAWAERVFALQALTESGRYAPATFAELARQARYLDPEGIAGVMLAGFHGGGDGARGELERLSALLSGLVETRLWEGRTVYARLSGSGVGDARVLPSETREVARALRALSAVSPTDPKVRVLEERLLALGGGDGWGNTNADIEAMLAIGERMKSTSGGPLRLHLRGGGGEIVGAQSGAMWSASTPDSGALTLSADAGGGKIAARVETRYLPSGDGSTLDAVQQGLVVERTAWRVPADGPMVDWTAAERLHVGDIVEERVRLVVPQDRSAVALVIPLAAGLEPMSAALATAPPEARPRGQDTRAADYRAWGDDQLLYVFDRLPAGTYEVYFRARAGTVGSFVQPPAQAALQYDLGVWGRSAGQRVVVDR